MADQEQLRREEPEPAVQGTKDSVGDVTENDAGTRSADSIAHAPEPPQPGAGRVGGQAHRDADRPRKARSAAAKWLLGLIGVFVTALVTAVAGQLGDNWFTGRASVAASQSQSQSPSNAAVQTAVRLMRVFDESGQLLPPYFSATTLHGGSCINSYESSDPNALRCFSGGQLADPCWNSGNEVACLSSPWDAEAIIIDDPTIEATPPPSIGPTPWALEIADPNHPGGTLDCGYAGGPAGTVAGMRINWACFEPDQFNPQGLRGYAIGTPQVSTTGPWTVFFSAADSSQAVQATVITVWR